MLDRALLARYLRQRAELGERELMLEGVTAEELLAALAPGPASAERGSGSSGERGKPATSRAAARAMIREVLAMPAADAASPAGAAHRSDGRQAGAAAVAHAPTPPLSPSDGARESGSPAQTALRALALEAAQCTACRLATAGRRQTVFGEGNPAAELVVVGEAPGQEEDRTGRPFVGPAGKLLDLLLLTAGFPRESVYICNTLKCRPPQNRNPLPDELAACSRFLKGQLGAIAPKVLLAVGKFAAQTLVGSEDSISRLRGRVFRYEGVPLVVTYHPAYLLRSPQWTVTAWEDFQLARKVLDEQA